MISSCHGWWQHDLTKDTAAGESVQQGAPNGFMLYKHAPDGRRLQQSIRRVRARARVAAAARTAPPGAQETVASLQDWCLGCSADCSNGLMTNCAQEAVAALKEALRLAQQHNDQRCLLHGLAGLCRLLSCAAPGAPGLPPETLTSLKHGSLHVQLLRLLRRCACRHCCMGAIAGLCCDGGGVHVCLNVHTCACLWLSTCKRCGCALARAQPLQALCRGFVWRPSRRQLLVLRKPSTRFSSLSTVLCMPDER